MKSLLGGIPQKPGIYIFKDESDKIIYVGKATNLKRRVASYFIKTDSSTSHKASRPWISVMISLIKNVETITVNNETEALMLEAGFIKQHQPKFNILMTDDKSYPYIKLTIKEEFPRLQVVRKRINDGSKYFGPFLSARSANTACQFLRKIYGVHISNRLIKTNQDRPCLNCQLEDTPCPFNNQIAKEAYALSIDKAELFLLGKRKAVIKDLEEKMSIASSVQNYEFAAKLRDQVNSLKAVTTKQNIIGRHHSDFDAIATAVSTDQACLVLTVVREGRIIAQYPFFYQLNYGQSQKDLVRIYLLTAYANITFVPPIVIIPEEIDDVSSIEKILSEIRVGTVKLKIAHRGEKVKILKLKAKNAQLSLDKYMLKQNSSIENVIALKELLKLDELPTRIEAVDISNLGASETVGATVCFVNGQPDKNEYRKYKIRSVEGQNDFEMVKEVVYRRFSDTTRPFPDLFMVDGGIEQLKSAISGYQLSAVGKQMKDKNLSLIRFISLAKKPDRIFLPERKLPLSIKRGDHGLLLLSRIRDEVHRFGINYQRQRQHKKSLGY